MKFEISGLNHIALVCKDMQRTVDFYTNILGFELVRSIDLPGRLGQHFFFDMGGRQCIAFFCFTEAGDRVSGVSNPRQLVDPAEFHQDPTAWISSYGSMNYFAFDVAPDMVEKHHGYGRRQFQFQTIGHDVERSFLIGLVDKDQAFDIAIVIKAARDRSARPTAWCWPYGLWSSDPW